MLRVLDYPVLLTFPKVDLLKILHCIIGGVQFGMFLTSMEAQVITVDKQHDHNKVGWVFHTKEGLSSLLPQMSSSVVDLAFFSTAGERFVP